MAKQKPLQAVQALALLHFSVRVTARPPKMAAQTIPASSAATKIKFRRQKLKKPVITLPAEGFCVANTCGFLLRETFIFKLA